MTQQPNERELPDDYPIFRGYLYVADGQVIRYVGDHDTTARGFKIASKRKSLTNCDIAARNLWKEMI